MNFRLFIYYCALCGGWAALVGWIFGRVANLDQPVLEAGLKGLCLGLFVSLALSCVDALWNVPLRQFFSGAMRIFVAVMVGSTGGLLGGMVGQALYGMSPRNAFLMFGWALTGLLIGASVGIYELLTLFMNHEPLRGAIRKVVNGILGGTVGGFLGGCLLVLLKNGFTTLMSGQPPEKLEQMWVPSASGFVALGMCIGLLIGVAQVVLKEAWVKVEAGRRAGRQMILSKPATTVGRAESCDIGLFGDAGVERAHARIIRQGNRFVLVDDGTPGGTFVNGQRIGGPTPLHDNDLIGVGKCLLRFGERQKH
jgi:hypothetical protein